MITLTAEPGVIGGICLILAFFAFQSLPVNWAGLLLLLFGVVLLIVENDLAFARFLLDAARARGFKGIVTTLDDGGAPRQAVVIHCCHCGGVLGLGAEAAVDEEADDDAGAVRRPVQRRRREEAPGEQAQEREADAG